MIAERPRELAVADIHGEDFRRAMLQEAVGEPAGRAAEISAYSAGDLHVKRTQAGLQLQAAANASDITASGPTQLTQRNCG